MNSSPRSTGSLRRKGFYSAGSRPHASKQPSGTNRYDHHKLFLADLLAAAMPIYPAPKHPLMPYHPPLPLSSPSSPLPLDHKHTRTAPRAAPPAGRPIRSCVRGSMAFFARGGRGSSSSPAVAAAVMVVVMMAGVARGDFAADRAECANQLMGLATCLTYVQDTATARAPTPDCCAGLKQVVSASKKCMCVLVKDRDEPALGFKINVTRAMDLPSVCNYPATFSDCPKILGMSPDAPEAEIFKEYAKKHEYQNGTTIPAAATGAAGGKSASSSSTGRAGAGSQPCTVFVYLASALLVLVSVLA